MIQEFPWALPWGTPSGGGVYLTVFPSSCPYTDTACQTGLIHTWLDYPLVFILYGLDEKQLYIIRLKYIFLVVFLDMLPHTVTSTL